MQCFQVSLCRMEAVQDAAQAVLHDIQSKFASRSHQPSAKESLQAFCAAVDWKVHLELVHRHSMQSYTRTVRPLCCAGALDPEPPCCPGFALCDCHSCTEAAWTSGSIVWGRKYAAFLHLQSSTG